MYNVARTIALDVVPMVTASTLSAMTRAFLLSRRFIIWPTKRVLVVPQKTARDVAKDAIVKKRHDLLDQAAQWNVHVITDQPIGHDIFKKAGV